ncbi:MAG TPA: hypothetical protein PLW93_01070 [Candidatus Absconditabacterales bacterium]|nr:hypothetical protein [Candidatus Absconditabacterales bacterium]HNG96843.1 hypothetical protein [Candidatus Absconditabacterales bacterium]
MNKGLNVLDNKSPGVLGITYHNIPLNSPYIHEFPKNIEQINDIAVIINTKKMIMGNFLINNKFLTIYNGHCYSYLDSQWNSGINCFGFKRPNIIQNPYKTLSLKDITYLKNLSHLPLSGIDIDKLPLNIKESYLTIKYVYQLLAHDIHHLMISKNNLESVPAYFYETQNILQEFGPLDDIYPEIRGYLAHTKTIKEEFYTSFLEQKLFTINTIDNINYLLSSKKEKFIWNLQHEINIIKEILNTQEYASFCQNVDQLVSYGEKKSLKFLNKLLTLQEEDFKLFFHNLYGEIYNEVISYVKKTAESKSRLLRNNYTSTFYGIIDLFYFTFKASMQKEYPDLMGSVYKNNSDIYFPPVFPYTDQGTSYVAQYINIMKKITISFLKL